MKILSIINSLELKPSKEEMEDIKKEVDDFTGFLKKRVKELKIKSDVFVGGSFAKGTLMRDKGYDVDIFLRFDLKKNEKENNARMAVLLDRILSKKYKSSEYNAVKVHGSRDYYRLVGRRLILEVIPVLKIKKSNDAENVTDLSYFHVNYVKKKIKNTRIAGEIRIAKAFCKSAGIYGAESYIQGFSGYALECLTICYKSFEKMLKEILKADEKIILDPEKHYKNKNDILLGLNESRLASPIVLVDPTWKDRNVLAALSAESFEKFKEAAKNFLKSPSDKFFKIREINGKDIEIKARKNKAVFLQVELKTNRQEGDIAGTKLKKFSRFLINEIESKYDVIDYSFNYSEGQKGILYLASKSKKEVIKKGPPLEMREAVIAFKKANKNIFEKEDRVYARINVNKTPEDFLKEWINDNKNKTRNMGIIGIKVG